MDGRRQILHAVLSVFCLGLNGCGSADQSEKSVAVDETVDRIARRIGSSLSLRKLNHLATHEDAFLDILTRSEREHLGRDYLRASTTVPMIVTVAAPTQSVPFWIEDQGFEPIEPGLKNSDSEWRLFQKVIQPGALGLGVNGLDRTPPAHYAVFLKPVNPCPGGPSTWLELRAEDAADWKIAQVEVDGGIGPAFDVFRPFVSLPDTLRGSVILQSRHERRHATLLAPARIWKTHVASGKIPDQITISFGADPSRELVWSWRTRPDVGGSRIRLALEPAGELSTEAELATPSNSKMQVLEGQSTVVETPCVLNDRAIRRHRVEVSGLQPDRSYVYSLGDGSAEGWSPWRRVRTAPGRPTHTQFLYLGDPQTGLEDWGRRLQAAYRHHPDARFMLIAGDLVDRGNERTNWDHFFLRSGMVFERLPLMPCVGNHEYLDQGPQLFKMFFDLPRNGPRTSEADLVYSFECGDAFFAILDSTMAVSSRRAAEEQASWLDHSLASSKARWKFVMFHHPVYASRAKRDNLALREHWVPVFDKHHVDIVFQGHDHTYIRTHPLRENRRVSSAREGTYYVVSVSGDKFYDQEPRSEFEVARVSVPTYQVVDLNPETGKLSYRSMSESGEMIDSFEIGKPVEASGPLRFARGK